MAKLFPAFRAVVYAIDKKVLAGGVRYHESHPFEKATDAEAWATAVMEINSSHSSTLSRRHLLSLRPALRFLA